MKIFKTIYIIFSILLLSLLIFNIINTTISIKYEIDEVRWFTDEINIDKAKEYLCGQIEILHYFLYYVLLNIVFLIISIYKK